jgi:hypothetical protein
MFTAIRAEQTRLGSPGYEMKKLRVITFNAQLTEALIHTRDAYVAEQAGHPKDPQVDGFFEGKEEGPPLSPGESLSEGGIILPGGAG